MSTTHQRRRAQNKQRRARQRPEGERRSEQRAGDSDRFGAGGVAGFLESVASESATTGMLAMSWVEEARRIAGIEEIFRSLTGSHWRRACERGWDDALGRRALRKVSAGLVRALFEGASVDIRENFALLAWLMRLPALPVVTRRIDPGDTKMVEKVRALLAKAESTTFPSEAEAFTMKAQQLITEHCLQEALADSPADDGPRLARIVAEDPYADSKSLLIAVVAAANRCRAVWFDEFGFASVIGYQADLDAVELIYASLLVQATRSMTMVGVDQAYKRSPSFRRSFLVAFASRIGERLKEAEQRVLEPIADDRLLPALAARDARVDDVMGELFPDTVSRPVSVSNGHGWAAGRSAADHANLLPYDHVDG